MSRSKFPAKDRQPGNLYAIAVLASLHTGSGIAFIRPILCSIISVLRWVLVLCFATNVSSLIAALTPLTTQDVSLMLRSGYSNEAVLRELSTRRFGDTFDSKAEQQLIKAGAGESLINALRSGVYQLSPLEIAAAAEKRSAQSTKVSEAFPKSEPDSQKENNGGISPAPNPPTDAQRGGSIYDHLKDDLVYWHEGNLMPFDDGALEKKKFYLFFFSAIWSQPGRKFTAQLIDYYNRVAPQHPEFEVVFFSADRSAFAMQNYFSQTNMPWPAIAYDKLGGKAGAIAERLTHQIPRLILADATGKVLSDSGETRPDFDKVLADLDKVLSGNR